MSVERTFSPIGANIRRLQEIDNQGGFEAFAKNNQTLIKNGLRRDGTDTVACSDGRIKIDAQRAAGTAVGAIHLFGRPEKKVMDQYKRAGVEYVTTHPGCSAAKAAYLSKFPGDAHRKDLDQRVERWQQEETEKITSRNGLKFKPLDHSHMTRTGAHSAPVIIVNGTGKIVKPARMGLPSSFIIDRKVDDKYDATVGVLAGVARKPGNAGHELEKSGGALRTVTIARSERDAANIQQRLREAAPDLKHEKIVIPRRA